MKGHIYDLTLVETEFRATGLDAAARVERRLNKAVRKLLEEDREVIAVVDGPWFRARASAKNFAPPKDAT